MNLADLVLLTKPKRINPNRIKTRDPLVLALINGATKAAVHTDRKKARSKKACRRPVPIPPEA